MLEGLHANCGNFFMANKVSGQGPYWNKKLKARTKGLFHILLMPHFMGFTKCKNFFFSWST
jgi:hypothetical protein